MGGRQECIYLDSYTTKQLAQPCNVHAYKVTVYAKQLNALNRLSVFLYLCVFVEYGRSFAE